MKRTRDKDAARLAGFIISDNENLPVSKEGSLFIGWMETRLKECIEVEDYEEAAKLKRDIQKARDTIQSIENLPSPGKLA
jgi:hypothetical protein